MRCPVRRIVLLLAASALGFAPAPVYKETGRDPVAVLKRLQGTWAMPQYESGGRTMISPGETYTVKIEKDQWTFWRSQNGGPLTKSSTYTLKLDPKANPAEVDFVQSPTYSLLGAYALEGNTVRVVFRVSNGMQKQRARDLAAPGPGDYLLRLERKP
jgi:uncharacterized protein (TIGR03067 family)